MADDENDTAYDQDPDASDNEQVVSDYAGDQAIPTQPSPTPMLSGLGLDNASQEGGTAPHQRLRQGLNSAAAAILSYLHGDGAADPDTVAQVEQQIDPDNSMDDGERHLRAIQAAHQQGGPQAAWSFVQANRQAYNAKMAFAKAALQGVGGKPPDIGAAAQAASDAYSHVPDGKNITFQPSQTMPGGITATVIGPDGSPQSQDLAPDQFAGMLDIGKDGLYDKVYQKGFGLIGPRNATMAALQGQKQTSAYSPVTPGEGDDNEPTGSPIISTGEPGSRPVGPDRSRGRSPSFGQGNGGEEYDSDLLARAQRIFPMAGDSQRKAEWLAKMQEARDTAAAEQGNKVKVAEAGNVARMFAANRRAEATENAATSRAGGMVDAARIRSQQQQTQSAAQIAARTNNAQLNAQVRAINGWQMANPNKELPPQMQAVLDQIVKPQAQQPTGPASSQQGVVQRTLKDGRTVNVRQIAPGKWQIVQ